MNTPCWIWPWVIDRQGYGQRGRDGHRVQAHRFLYELLIGTIPEGAVLDHLCRNRACVNPTHLEPVTQGINVLRGNSPTKANARKTACPLGHPYDYRRPNGHRGCKRCRRAQTRAWYAANIEHARATQRDYERRKREGAAR